MPLSNLWRNCAYYWSFGAFIGYPLCQPGQHFPDADGTQVQAGLAIFAISEICNLICHVSYNLNYHIFTHSFTHIYSHILTYSRILTNVFL